MRYAFVIDQSRCIGCHACSLACKAEHNVPVGSYRTWVKYVEKGAFPDVRRFFSVLRCNHCDDAPCMTICPVTALFRRDNGIVDFDRGACIGCKACMQACPYDALYIHPDHGTAEKCNFCAHRVENEMEPPCATVCPTESIVVGDIDDPDSRVSRLISTQNVSVRKPEKGTRPKVFYIQGEPAGLTPGADAGGGYMWADRAGDSFPDYPTASYGTGAAPGVTPSSPAAAPRGATVLRDDDAAGNTAAGYTGAGYAGVGDLGSGQLPPAGWAIDDVPPAAAAQAAAAVARQADADFYSGAWSGLRPARAVYDVAHAENPWGWKVSAYLWTKSVAAGAFVIAALAPWLSLTEPAATVGIPIIGLVFLALTGVLLVADLKRPARFWTILTRPNWDSWLARGAFIIAVFGALAVVWTGWAIAATLWPERVAATMPGLLRWPLIGAAMATAGYSGYLFAQARGRDFWQSPLSPVHLVVQAIGAGAGATALALSHALDAHSHDIPLLLAAALIVHLAMIACGEVTIGHPTRDGAIAAREMVRGRYARPFWSGVGLAVIAVVAAFWGGPVGGGAVVAGAAALAGLGLYEHAWNLAGQTPPLS